jgi:hypothetical protein
MKIVVIFLVIASISYSQQGDGGIPKGYKIPVDIKKMGFVSFDEPNIAALKTEDEENEKMGSGPWRFGFNNPCGLNLSNGGTWFDLPNGSKLWRLLVHCEKALTINLTFKNLIIPEGNELYVYNPDQTFILGKFSAYHTYEGQLGTELISGEDVIVEYFIPFNNEMGSLELETVTHGYRTANEFQEKAFGSSGACNFNVNCAQGAAWVNERNSAVMLVSGSNGFCSGALVSNVLNDGKPYVLTADHCYSNPASWIFRFNWQALNCPNPGTSPSFVSLNGAVLRARGATSDFCLVEITGGLQAGTVPVAYTPYFAGWDNSNTTPASAVCIHHPSGDIKKISFENDPLVSTSWGGGPANTHWGITNWDSGVTEPGSSGSPIFDQNHRVVGQLHGGASACGAAALSDEYGKFGYSWNPAGSDSTNQLKYWLDPLNSGAIFIDGYDPAGGVAVQVDPGASNLQGVSGTYCSAEVTPSFSLVNNGAVTLTTATITYGFDGVNNLIYNWSGILPQWQSVVVNLPAATLTNGAHTFSATVTNTNAGVDENNLNNAVNSSFLIVLNGVSVVMDLTLDCFGSETSWELQNVSGTAIYAGNGYADDEPGMVSETWCLNYGCYSYVLIDSYGDGLSNNGLCATGDGNLLISQAGDTLASISTAAADFGDQVTLDFCLSGAGLNELENNNMVIFPNPSNGVVMISLEHQTTGVFQVLTLTGQIMEEYDFNGQQFKMNLTVLSAGSYFIRFIEQGGKSSIKKLVLN